MSLIMAKKSQQKSLYSLSLPIRYPGGKKKLAPIIINKLESMYKPGMAYCEPFVGAGGVALSWMKSKCPAKNIMLNDKDDSLMYLWYSIHKYCPALIDMVQKYTPCVEDFYSFKSDLQSQDYCDHLVNHALKKLAIHQISYSGLGTKSGGPLGGDKQKSKYKINCRWSPDYICKKLLEINELMTQYKMELTKFDCNGLLFRNSIRSDVQYILYYIDPPYYNKGNELYQEGFNKDDHVRLAEQLRHLEYWVLSYDDTPEIRELYKWANITTVIVNYTMNSSRYKQELIITPC